jgi:hypothetical protein
MSSKRKASGFLDLTTLNVISLLGVMLAGIAVSNSILIVEFAHHLLKEGLDVRSAIVTSCRVRLRPVLMTSLATIIGLANGIEVRSRQRVLRTSRPRPYRGPYSLANPCSIYRSSRIFYRISQSSAKICYRLSSLRSLLE